MTSPERPWVGGRQPSVGLHSPPCLTATRGIGCPPTVLNRPHTASRPESAAIAATRSSGPIVSSAYEAPSHVARRRCCSRGTEDLTPLTWTRPASAASALTTRSGGAPSSEFQVEPSQRATPLAPTPLTASNRPPT